MKGIEEDLSVVEEDDSAELEAGLLGRRRGAIVKLVNSLIADAMCARAPRTSTPSPTSGSMAGALPHRRRDAGR